MPDRINHITTFFEAKFSKKNHWKVPADIISLINKLDNPERRALRDRLFNVAREIQSKDERSDALNWLQQCFMKIDEHSFRFHQVYFSPGYDILDNLKDLIQVSTKSIDICVFSLTDHRLAKVVVEAQNRGVKVRIISDDLKTKDRGSKIEWLKENGIEIKIDQSMAHMHNKFGIVDRRIAFTGSFNWTKSATRANNENLLVTSNHSIVEQFSEEFEQLWKEMHKF